jgi:hypothetical protein
MVYEEAPDTSDTQTYVNSVMIGQYSVPTHSMVSYVMYMRTKFYTKDQIRAFIYYFNRAGA